MSNPNILGQMWNAGQKMFSAPTDIANHAGIAGAGALIGVPKGLVDIPMYGAGLASRGYNALTGQVDKNKTDFLEKYETGAENLAMNIGSLGKVDLNDQSARRAAASGLFIGSFVDPTHLPGGAGLAKALGKTSLKEAGLSGVIGEAVAKGAQAKTVGIHETGKLGSKIIDPLIKTIADAPGATKKVMDPVFQSIVKAVRKEEVIKKPETDRVFQEIASVVNSKTATNVIMSKDPHIFPILGEKYNTPISKIDDLAAPLYDRYNTLKIKHEGLDLESFVKLEVDDLNRSAGLSNDTKELLKTQMVDMIKRRESIYNTGLNKDLFEAEVLKQSQLLKIKQHVESNTFNPDFSLGVEASELYKSYNPQDLLQPARKLMKSHEANYINDLTSGIDTETATSKLASSKNEIYNKLKDVDPIIAAEFHVGVNQSFVGNLGRIGNMFKVEPIFGDATQIADSIASVSLANAQRLGIDYTDSIAQQYKGFDSWKKNPSIQQAIKVSIIDPHKTLIDALENKIISESKLGISNKIDNIFNWLSDVGMSNQIQFRERMVSNTLLPTAYGQIKSWGKYKEGTPEFNNAVLNTTKTLMQETGLIPPEESKVLYRHGEQSIVGRNVIDTLNEHFQKGKSESGVSRELAAGSSFMLKWVKGAAEAKLKAYNNLADSLSNVSKTGKVSDIDRTKILNSTFELALGVYLFGARGLRIPGSQVEISTDVFAGSDAPDTAATKVMEFIGNLVGIDRELKKSLKDGLMYQLTGLSSARTSNIPLVGPGSGFEIAQGIFEKKIMRFLNNIGANISSRTLDKYILGGGLGADLVNTLFGSADVDIAADTAVFGARRDGKGNLMQVDTSKHILGGMPGMDFSKNLAPGTENTTAIDAGNIDSNLKKKYKALPINVLVSKENIRNMATELKDIYPDSPDKIKKVIKDTIKSKFAPKSSELYQELKSDISDYLAMDVSVLKNLPELRNITNDEALDMAAETLIIEKDKKTAKLLMKLGKLDLNNSEVKEELKLRLKKKAQELKGIIGQVKNKGEASE